MKRLLLILLLTYTCMAAAYAQDEDNCSELGVWLWRFEQTGQVSHTNLARTIASMGAKRIYVKVADGGFDPSSWSTILDGGLIKEYIDEGVSPWAWSYNYKGNVAAQSQALYFAAKTGYEGYVIDIEIEFNGEDETLEALMQAFYAERERAIADGFANEDFKLYVTTWGNPILHNYRIDIIDKYVDGYMPQTYIEEWGGSHLNQIEACIQEGVEEYESLGATKPLHHILSTAQEILTAEEITRFLELSGPESSLWRVPGGGVPFLVWDRWRDVDWGINFCESVSTSNSGVAHGLLYPNPASDKIHLKSHDEMGAQAIEIYRQDGALILSSSTPLEVIDISTFPAGMYYLVELHKERRIQHRFIKI